MRSTMATAVGHTIAREVYIKMKATADCNSIEIGFIYQKHYLCNIFCQLGVYMKDQMTEGDLDVFRYATREFK